MPEDVSRLGAIFAATDTPNWSAASWSPKALKTRATVTSCSTTVERRLDASTVVGSCGGREAR
eukprot:4564011-Prymnesium_polylepis.1